VLVSKLEAWIITIIGLGLVSFYGSKMLLSLPGPLADAKTLIFAKGTTSWAITEELSAANVISHPTSFWVIVNLLKYTHPLKAGEYLFTTSISPWQVIMTMASGKSITHKLTITEGTTAYQALDQINTAIALVGNNITQVSEGSILPDTYFFSYGDTKQKLLTIMQDKMSATLSDAWERKENDLPLKTKEEALILASIIEKETGYNSERARVAGIFINRLRINMPLQADPTVIYALTLGQNDFTREITKTDLKSDSAYNTYLHKGLPPTPICNPGKAAIEAALHPHKSTELYFVVDVNGGHQFSSNLSDHNRHVNNFRKNIAGQKKN
jgi:UPF0755 protein